MASEERLKKINELIKRELGKMMLEELEFASGVFVTITKVETFKDLGDAKIAVSVFPVGEIKKVLKILDSQAGRLQYLLNRKLSMRFVPRIKFVADKELGKIQQVEAILGKVKIEEED
jgi:ribosome-binding factor A